ncbi:MAG: hypothetical protein Q9191_004330 [Dirinaria sp. TL-2023a]
MSYSSSWGSSSSETSSRSYKRRYSPTRPSSSSAVPSYEPGCMFNLPGLEECSTFSCNLDGIEKGIFNHPVLLLEADGDHGYVLVTSSLDGKKLEEYHRKEYHVQMEHMPLLPAQSHHLTGEQLKFDQGLTMPRPCYVKIRDSHKIPLVCLKPYLVGRDQAQLRLAADSLFDLRWARDNTNADRELKRGAWQNPLPVSPPQTPSPPQTCRPSTITRDLNAPWRGSASSTPRSLNDDWRRINPRPAQTSERRLGFGPDGMWRRDVESSSR